MLPTAGFSSRLDVLACNMVKTCQNSISFAVEILAFDLLSHPLDPLRIVNRIVAK